jgi:hypothetical protein
MLEIDISLYQVTSRCVKNRGSNMTSLQSTTKKALNLQGMLSSQNLILTQVYLPESAVLEARGAQILGAKSLWQLSFFFMVVPYIFWSSEWKLLHHSAT